MSDALQVFVRGFEDTKRGDVIRDYLTRIGFNIETYFTGEADDLGGLMETNVVGQDGLEVDDPEAILADLRRRTGFDGVWLQTKEFELAEEAEYGREEEDQTEEMPDDDWIIEHADELKSQLLELAQAGAPQPVSGTLLGRALEMFTDAMGHENQQ